MEYPEHWRAKRDPKAEMLSLQSFLRKGVALGYVGHNENLQDLKGPTAGDTVQGYLAHKNTPTTLVPPQDPRHRPTVGS